MFAEILFVLKDVPFHIRVIRYTLFFISNAFFQLTSVLLNFLMNGALNVAKLLFNTYKHHHSETLFIFTIFASMSRPRFIHVISM